MLILSDEDKDMILSYNPNELSEIKTQCVQNQRNNAIIHQARTTKMTNINQARTTKMTNKKTELSTPRTELYEQKKEFEQIFNAEIIQVEDNNYLLGKKWIIFFIGRAKDSNKKTFILISSYGLQHLLYYNMYNTKKFLITFNPKIKTFYIR